MPGPQSSPVHVSSGYCYLILTPTPIKEVIFLSLVWRGGNGFCQIRSLNHSDLGSERQGKILTPNPEGSKTQSLCRTGPHSTGMHLTSTPPRCEGNRQESGSVAALTKLPLRWNYTHKHGGMHTHTHTRADIEHTQACTQKHVCTRTHTLAHTHTRAQNKARFQKPGDTENPVSPVSHQALFSAPRGSQTQMSPDA